MESLPRADTQTRNEKVISCGRSISGAEKMDHIGSKTQTAVKGNFIARAHALGAQRRIPNGPESQILEKHPTGVWFCFFQGNMMRFCWECGKK